MLVKSYQYITFGNNNLHMKFSLRLFFDFNDCREFSIAISFILSYFLNFIGLFSFISRMELLYQIYSTRFYKINTNLFASKKLYQKIFNDRKTSFELV
jgi:hypothetical protein